MKIIKLLLNEFVKKLIELVFKRYKRENDHLKKHLGIHVDKLKRARSENQKQIELLSVKLKQEKAKKHKLYLQNVKMRDKIFYLMNNVATTKITQHGKNRLSERCKITSHQHDHINEVLKNGLMIEKGDYTMVEYLNFNYVFDLKCEYFVTVYQA